MVECTGLENQRAARYRGFESLSLRDACITGWVSAGIHAAWTGRGLRSLGHHDTGHSRKARLSFLQFGVVAQLVEHWLCKPDVVSSSLTNSTHIIGM